MLSPRHALGMALTVVVLGALGLIGLTTSAHAAPDVPEGCWTEEYTDSEGFSKIVVACPEGVGNNPGTGGGDGGGNVEPIGDRECTYGPGITVECETTAGVWNGTCYVKVADPQPDKDHPVWAGREDDDGVIIQCTAYDASMAEDCDADGGCPAGVSLRWAAGPPDEGPSPARLARRAVAQMQLAMGEIGSTPPEGTTSSLVGMPIWLWVANPAPNTVGPLTVRVTDDGLTVAATATLDRIDYTMGGGAQTIADVTCAGTAAPGTPYEAHYGDRPSPTCGITVAQNQRVGSYTITGTAYWIVEWSGGGQTGTISVDVDNSIQMDVGEAQVVRVG